MIPDADALGELERVMEDLETFHVVHCERKCDFSTKTWTPDEAEIRAEVHEHDCLIRQEAIMDSEHPELGLTEGDD